MSFFDFGFIFECNKNAIWEATFKKKVKFAEPRNRCPKAAALFSNLSLLNHSCEPNIEIEHKERVIDSKKSDFTGKNLDSGLKSDWVFVYARDVILSGQEVFNSYIDITGFVPNYKKLLKKKQKKYLKCLKIVKSS